MAGEDTNRYTLIRELAHGMFAGSGLLPTVLGSSTAKGSTTTLQDGRDIAWSGINSDYLDGRWVYWHRTRGTASAGGAATLTTDKNWGVNELAGMEIELTGGTGAGQVRTIASNTVGPNSVITVTSNWTTQPDATTGYAVYPTADNVYYARATNVTSAGIITFDPAMTAVIESLSDYSLHLFHPKLLIEAINWALGKMKYRTLVAVSELADGDMEDVGRDHWADINTPTVTKEDASESEIGRQWLKVVADAAADGVASDDVWVEAGEPYRYFSLLRVDGAVNSVDVILTDTDGSDFETVNIAPRRFVEVRVTGNIPTGCERIQAQFKANGGAVTFYVVYAQLLLPNKGWIEVPRFANAGQIQEVLRLPSGQAGVSTDTYQRMARRMEPVLWYPEVDARAGKQAKIVVGPMEDPLFVRGSRSYPTLSSDREVTRVDKDAVLAGARVRLRGQLADAEILAGSTAVLSALKATEEEDRDLWNEAVYGSGEGIQTRMRGLRSYLKG